MSACLFTLLLLSVWPFGRAFANSGYYGYRLEALDNRIFTDSPVFQYSGSLKPGECALICAHHVTCAAFTFVASSGLCRGHSVFTSLYISNSASITVADAQTWVLGCPQADRYLRVSPSRCLRLFMNGMPQPEAKSRCEQDGGGLFMMKTWDDKTLLTRFIVAHGHVPQKTSVWLGGEQQPGEGEWVWRDGDILLLNNTLWYPGEPNNQGGAECLQTWNNRLDDKNCFVHRVFVCDIIVP